MISPAKILVAYIISVLGKMTDPSDGNDWPLYETSMPDAVDVESDCGAVYGTPGVGDGRLMTGTFIEHPGIQLRIRSKDNDVGYGKIEDIATALDAVSRGTITIDSVTYRLQNIRRASPSIPLGVEPGTRRRHLFTVNYLLTVKQL